MEKQKIFFEMTKSEYEDLQSLLLELAVIEQECKSVKLLVRQALTDDNGTARIASQLAANILLGYVVTRSDKS